MSQDALKYLQRDDIGKVIAKGLASVYSKKPERPVKYLAEWLKSYSSTKKQLSTVTMQQKTKKQFLTLFEQTAKVNELREKETEMKKKEFNQKINHFKNMVAHHEYQEQLLEEILPQFVQKSTNVNGAYIGELNHPLKNITEEDTDENAHLNTAAEKVINYIGSSVSHKGLMRGKMLKLSEGITAKVFLMGEQQPAAVGGGEQGQEQQKQKQKKQKYLYIPNVVKNESMHYFKIPKLGAYLAIPFICKSYLGQKIFDQILVQRKKQINENEQFNKKKNEQLQQLNKSKEQLNKRINDLKQKNAEESQIIHLNGELAEMEKKIADKKMQKYNQAELVPNFNKKSYVFCVDNLGRDQELDNTDIELINDLVEHFKASWQDKQKQLLFKDISTQIEYLKDLPSTPQQIKSELEKARELDEQTTKQLSQIEDQFLRAYKTQEQEFNRLKNHIKNNQIFLNSFLVLRKFRVIKYKQLLQNFLFLLGQSKANINLPNKAVLNWKAIKDTHINKEIFSHILDFVVHGPKDKNFKFYAKTPFLLEFFEKYNQDELFMYNVGLGALVNFIKKALKHRINNVKLRKSQREAQRKQRQTLIDQNQKIDILKEQELKIHKDNLPPEEVQGFKQEDWAQKFDKEHPKHEVPPEVVDDIDNDM